VGRIALNWRFFLELFSHVGSIGLPITNLSDIALAKSDHFSPITLRRAPDLSLTKVTLAQGGPLTFHFSPVTHPPNLSLLTNHQSPITSHSRASGLAPPGSLPCILSRRFAFGISYSRLRARAIAGRLSSSSKAVISTPLAPEDLGRFIADALHGETERVIRRAQLVTDSTWQDREGEQSS
jgi:hypothetical protein